MFPNQKFRDPQVSSHC
uniref:Uncharacterized protein n=1 Tax=Arundo donax TaxID=35708 RepID=A0A0A9A0A8_ARUDO